MIVIILILAYSVWGCEESCLSVRNNGRCEKECFTLGCEIDEDDCNAECYPGCRSSMIGDGICQEACMVSECEIDEYDCYAECSRDCLGSSLGNGVCESECNSEECEYDRGDCVKEVWVRNGSISGDGSINSPLNSLSSALEGNYGFPVVRVSLLPGIHTISGIITPSTSIETVIIQKASCSYCDSSVSIRPISTGTRFIFVDRVNVTIQDLIFDWREKLVRGCEMSECIYCFTWVCQSSVCTTPSGVTLTRTNPRLNYCQTLGCTDDYRFLYFENVSKVRLTNLTFQNIALASDIIFGYSSSFIIDSLVFLDIQLTGPLIYLESLARAGASNTFLDDMLYSMPYIENTDSALISNISVTNINTHTHFNPKSFCDKSSTKPGLLHAKYLYKLDISNISIEDFYVISKTGVDKGMIDCESCGYAIIKNGRGRRVYVPYAGFVNMKPTLVMGEFDRENVSIQGIDVEDGYLSSSLVRIGTEGLVGNVEIKEVRGKRLSGDVSILKVEYPEQDSGEYHYLVDLETGNQWEVPKRYITISNIDISDSALTSSPYISISNVQNLNLSQLSLSSISSNIPFTFPYLFSSKSYSGQDLIYSTLFNSSPCTSIISILSTQNSSYTQLSFNSINCATGPIITSSNIPSSIFKSLNFCMNESTKLIEESGSYDADITYSEIYAENNDNSHSLIHLNHETSNRVLIENSRFIESRVHVVYMESPNVRIHGCYIERSVLNYGTIYIRGDKDIEVSICDSRFQKNTGFEKAADVYIDMESAGFLKLDISDSVFSKSTAPEAVSIETTQTTRLSGVIKNCVFDNMIVNNCKIYIDKGVIFLPLNTGSILISSTNVTNISGYSASFLYYNIQEENPINSLEVLNSEFSYCSLAEIFLLTNIHIPKQARISHTFFLHNTGNLAKLLKTTAYLDSLYIYNNTSLSEPLFYISEFSTLSLINSTFNSNSQLYYAGILSITASSNSSISDLKFLNNKFPSSDSVFMSSGHTEIRNIYIYENDCKDSRVIYMQDMTGDIGNIEGYSNRCGIALIGSSRVDMDVRELECQNETGCIDVELSDMRLKEFRSLNVSKYSFMIGNSKFEVGNVIMRNCKDIGMRAFRSSIKAEKVEIENCGVSEVIESNIEIIQSQLYHNSDASIHFIDSTFYIEDSIFLNNTANSLIFDASYGLISSTKFNYNSDSAILLHSGQLSITNSSFSSNTAYSGACLYSTCSEPNCTSISYSSFSSNSAYIGGAIYYSSIQPIFSYTSFSQNSAIYGPDQATQASSLTLETSSSVSNLRSGSILPPIQVSIRDSLSQILYIDSSSVGSILPTENSTILTGGDRVLFNQGVIEFNFLKVIHPPNSNTTLTLFTSSSLEPISIHLNFRECIPGEVLTLNSCEICGNNTYSFNPEDGYCLSCPREAECYGYDVIFPKPGYWRSGRFSDKFYKCPYENACLGSSVDKMMYEGECELGYSGTLCSVCIGGYFQYGGNKCTECPEDDNFDLLISGVVIGAIAFFSFMIWSHCRNCTKPKKQGNLMLKTLITYLQTIRYLNIYSISWPDVLLKFFEGASIGGDSGSQVLTLDCRSFNLQFLDLNKTYTKVLISSILPVLFCVGLLIFWFAVTFHRETTIYLKRHFISSIVIVLVVLTPSVLDSSLSMIGCREIDGVDYLIKDYSIECYSKDHIWVLNYIVTPTVFIYGIFLPGILFIILYRNRHQLNEEQNRMRYGIVFLGYKPRLWFWELCQFYRKVLLKGALICVAGYSGLVQATSILIILILVLLLQLAFKPYEHESINNLEFHSILSGTMTITLGLYFINNNSPEFNIALAWCILLLNSFFVICWGMLFFKISRDLGSKLLRLFTTASITLFRRSRSRSTKVSPSSLSENEDLDRTVNDTSFCNNPSTIAESPAKLPLSPTHLQLVTFRNDLQEYNIE
jgi:hypothetical protein